MKNRSINMAGMIGRYKGTMSTYAEELRNTAKRYKMDDLLKSRLEFIASRMENTIADNDTDWDAMFQPETDLVELERA
jgi:hypothetical protein